MVHTFADTRSFVMTSLHMLNASKTIYAVAKLAIDASNLSSLVDAFAVQKWMRDRKLAGAASLTHTERPATISVAHTLKRYL